VGGGIHWTQRSGDMFMRGRDGSAQALVLRGATVALWSKLDSQETFFTQLANSRLVGTPWVC
jgi:hypothetical protein